MAAKPDRGKPILSARWSFSAQPVGVIADPPSPFMSVLKTLRERVTPELNHLYTTPPGERPGGVDFGWHSREHALHTFFVAALFGAEAGIALGDFAVISRFVPPLTSMGTNQDHAWCVVNGVAPVDLSLTFLHYGNVPQLHAPIVGEGRNGDWHIEYAEDESALDESVQERNDILYIEKSLSSETAAQLLANPYLLFPAPAPEDATGWPARFGPSIYAKISLHCFRCATGEAKSIRQRLAREPAIAWIAENYAEPEAELLRCLQK